ncbi:hypothetical protein [Nocardia huaxiensis]|uniref:Uncharacterized protein n=1 Tax=Nocardia huaxiensis TaxID=2755382 RepID=A0A7D6VDC2_9NOCA|nr:hypothetical protein [Nocardia huaxiensis]QLY27536.1 hypothetical protein H0264_09770 [Nocardia huaxiensis]UFS93787.1 hypothetical protein LPY97_23675 [Nocardia huaxiensis]
MTSESDRPSEEPRPAARPAGSRRLSAADKARLARIFGDPLPSTTSDERAPEPEQGQSSDEWLRSQVPPHHG